MTVSNCPYDVPLTSQHRQILDCLPVGAVLITPDFTIVEWNRTMSEWSGISRTDAVASNLLALFPSVQQPRYRDRLNEVFRTGLSAVFSPALHGHFLPLPATHGLTDQLMVQKTEARLLPGCELASLTIQDVSVQSAQVDELKRERRELKVAHAELKVSNKELVEAVTELNQFSYATSHDLQEPLRTIAGFADLLRREIEPDPDSRGDYLLSRIQRSTSQMSSLVKAVLRYSRLGRSYISAENVSLQDCVNSALAALSLRISANNTIIECAPMPVVRGDAALLTSLFQNLLSNAIKFSDNVDAPQITISAEQSGQEWIVRISDNGIGVESKYHELIFLPFKRLHSPSEYPGSGIGLAICRRIIERHKGTISVTRAASGGAEFILCFPSATSQVFQRQD